MARLLRMPGISADAEEVVFLEWCTSPGSTVSAGEAIATVETEKANVDIEADGEAILWRTLIEPGASVAVGFPIAVLVGVDEEVGDESALLQALGLTSATDMTTTAQDVEQVEHVEQPVEPSPVAERAGLETAVSHERVFSSPIARKMARENGLRIETVTGTGPGSRIVRADIERALENRSTTAPQALSTTSLVPTEAGYVDIPHSGMRRAIARALAASKREVPHFYLDATCHVDSLLAMRREINEAGSVKVSINDFIVKAAAKALVEVPDMNVVWMEDCVRRFETVDIAVAIGSQSGLVTPVIRSAEKMTLSALSAQVKDFVDRAAHGRLKQPELEGGSFAVSNLGMHGVESFAAIINPPQAAILAVGAVVDSAVVVHGSLQVGKTMTVRLSVDHRPVDGVIAAKWLARFKDLLENPARMLV